MENNKCLSKKIIFVLSLLPGLFFWGVYQIIFANTKYAFSLFSAKESIAHIISSYSSTFLGFLLTIASILFSLSPNYNRKRYEKLGYLSLYKFMLILTAIYLALSFILSILLLSNSAFSCLILKILLALVMNSLALILIDFFILFNLSVRKGGEEN